MNLRRAALFIAGLTGVLALAKEAPPVAATVAALDVTAFYLSPQGDDAASGLTPEAPMATVEAVLKKLQQQRGFEWQRPPGGRNGLRVSDVRAVVGPASYGIGAAGPVVIWFRGGRYELKQPIKLGLADSQSLTLAAFPGEKPVLDGSAVITGWKDAELNGKKVWVADIPAGVGRDGFFRQLFVNGRRAPRSTWPATGDLIVAGSPDGLANTYVKRFEAAPGDLCPLENPAEVDVSMMHYWTNDRLQVTAYDPATRVLTTANGSGLSLYEAHPLHEAGKRNARYRLENVRAGLLQGGQWYLDRRAAKVYYLPRPGETPANTEIRAPRLVQLVTAIGDVAQSRCIENLRFTGLTFEHTDVDFFKHLGTHNWSPCTGPGVVYFEGVRNSAIEDCEFREIGEYGVELAQGSSGITVAGNRFTELGCGAVKTMGSTLTSGDVAAHTWMNFITDNTILRGGRVYHDSPGILATRPFGFVIAHNEIVDFYYNGIAICGGGGMSELAALECRIEDNLIHQIGQGQLSDMGGIYLNSMGSGTLVRGNVVYDVKSKIYGGNVLYLDDCCSQITVEDNLFYDGSDQVLISKGRGNVIRNNILAFGGNAIVRVGEREAAALEPLLLLHNILVTRGAPVFAAMPGVPILKGSGILSDANLVWATDGAALTVATHKNGPHQPDLHPWAQWLEKTGNDRCSLVADPLFKDAPKGDFTFLAGSGAEAAGYAPVDFSHVGPRSPAERAAARGQPAAPQDFRAVAQ